MTDTTTMTLGLCLVVLLETCLLAYMTAKYCQLTRETFNRTGSDTREYQYMLERFVERREAPPGAVLGVDQIHSTERLKLAQQANGSKAAEVLQRPRHIFSNDPNADIAGLHS